MSKYCWILRAGKFWTYGQELGVFDSKELLEKHPVFNTPGLQQVAGSGSYGEWSSKERSVWVVAHEFKLNEHIELDFQL